MHEGIPNPSTPQEESKQEIAPNPQERRLPPARPEEDYTFASESEIVKDSPFFEILNASTSAGDMMAERRLFAEFQEKIQEQLAQKEGIQRNLYLEKNKDSLRSVVNATKRVLDHLYTQAPKGELSYRTGDIPAQSKAGFAENKWKSLRDRSQALLERLEMMEV